jgi:hypothetical protein
MVLTSFLFPNGGLGLSFENPLDGKTAAVLPGLGSGDPADENGNKCGTHNQGYELDSVLNKRIENDLNNCNSSLVRPVKNSTKRAA